MTSETDSVGSKPEYNKGSRKKSPNEGETVLFSLPKARIWVVHFLPNQQETDYQFPTMTEVEDFLIGDRFNNLADEQRIEAIAEERALIQTIKFQTAEIVRNLKTTPFGNLSFHAGWFRKWLNEQEIYANLRGDELLQVADRLTSYQELKDAAASPRRLHLV